MPSETSIPARYVDGTTTTWTENLPDYTSGAGVAVLYRFFGPQQFTVNGQGSGTSWVFSIQGGKLPGDYAWQKIGVKAGVTTELGSGQIRNLPNFSAEAPTSWAAEALAAAQAAFTGLAAGTIQSASINGESYTYADRTGLLQQIERLKAIVQSEQDALKIQVGLPTGRRILTRLSRW